MLVLKLKWNETLVIDSGNIVVTVVETSKHYCKLGVDAPKQIPVNRGEVQAKIDAAKFSSREGAAE